MTVAWRTDQLDQIGAAEELVIASYVEAMTSEQARATTLRLIRADDEARG